METFFYGFSNVLARLLTEPFDAYDLMSLSEDIDCQLFSPDDFSRLDAAKQSGANCDKVEFCNILQETGDPCTLVTIAEIARCIVPKNETLAKLIEDSIIDVFLQDSNTDHLDIKKKTFESLMGMFYRLDLYDRIADFRLDQHLDKPAVKWYFKTSTEPFNVNRLSVYFPRINIEREILEKLKIAVQSPYQSLTIIGGGGVGKTAIMSHLFVDNEYAENFMIKECNFNVAIWLNCSQWRDDSFDTTDFSKRLVEVCQKVLFQNQPFCLFSLEEALNRLMEKSKPPFRPLFIFDDMLNAKLLKFFCERCPDAAFCIITRDVSIFRYEESSIPFGSVVFIPEFDDSEVKTVLKTTYDLAGKLSDQQIEELANQCSRLPVIVGLVGSCFRYSNSTGSSMNQLTILMKELNKKQCGCPDQAIDELFEFILKRIDDELEKMFYAFLLWNPGEDVLIGDLAVIWGFATKLEAWEICKCYENLVMVQGVRGSRKVIFIVHQMLYEAAIRARLKLPDVDSLYRLRLQIAKGLCLHKKEQSDSSQILNRIIKLQKWALLERIFNNLDEKCLFEICAIPIIREEESSFCKWFLQYASRKGQLEIVKFLCDKCPKAAEVPCDISGQTLLSFAAEAGHLQVVKFLFEKYPKTIEEPCRDSKTPLSYATEGGHFSVVKFLIEKYPKAAAIECNSGRTPLSYAAEKGYLEIAKCLFEKYPKATEMSCACYEKTPLLYATEGGHFNVVKFLIEKNPKAAAMECDSGRTPLSYAAEKGYLEIAKCLFEKYPKATEISCIYGKTPLSYAAEAGRLDMVKFLIEKNRAAAKITDLSDQTPLSLAKSHNRQDVVEFLSSQIRYTNTKTRSAKSTIVMFKTMIYLIFLILITIVPHHT